MSKRWFDSRVICRNEIDGVVISSVRLGFSGNALHSVDDAPNGYEMCVFFPSGESHVVAMSGIEQGIIMHHNNLVRDMMRYMITDAVDWVCERFDLPKPEGKAELLAALEGMDEDSLRKMLADWRVRDTQGVA